jgi:hypothetical protein
MVAAGDIGYDFAWSKPSIAALKAAGATYVMRYLSWNPPSNPNRKVIEQPEYDSYLAAGIAVGLNWEFSADDQRGGAANGRLHGAEAARQARALGAQPGDAIYFSADWDVQASQLPTCRAYWAAAQEMIAPYKLGVYAGYRAASDALDRGFFGWQTYAWSYGRWDDRAHIRQIKNGVTVGGADCDRNVLIHPTAGLVLPEGDDMTPEEHQWLKSLVYIFTTNTDSPRADASLIAKVDSLVKSAAADTDTLAQKIAAALIAANTNGLTAADHAGIVSDVKKALAEGTA